jgi:hypothetical protein
MNAYTPTEMEGVVERFDDLGELEEGWQALSRSDIRQEEETRRSVARVRRAFVVTVLMLLFLNSAGLVKLVQGLSIGPVQDTIIVMSETWHGEMERHGVADILESIRGEVEAVVERPWEDVRTALPDLRTGAAEATIPETENRATLLRGTVSDPSGEASGS